MFARLPQRLQRYPKYSLPLQPQNPSHCTSPVGGDSFIHDSYHALLATTRSWQSQLATVASPPRQVGECAAFYRGGHGKALGGKRRRHASSDGAFVLQQIMHTLDLGTRSLGIVRHQTHRRSALVVNDGLVRPGCQKMVHQLSSPLYPGFNAERCNGVRTLSSWTFTCAPCLKRAVMASRPSHTEAIGRGVQLQFVWQ